MYTVWDQGAGILSLADGDPAPGADPAPGVGQSDRPPDSMAVAPVLDTSCMVPSQTFSGFFFHCGLVAIGAECLFWVPECNLADFFWGAFLRSGRPRGHETALKLWGARGRRPPHF